MPDDLIDVRQYSPHQVADGLRALADDLARSLPGEDPRWQPIAAVGIALQRYAADLLDVQDGLQVQALRLIITHCPALAAQAATVLTDRGVGAAQRQLQVDRLAKLALGTGAAHSMTPEERVLLAGAMGQGVAAGEAPT
jgi:hypothetical protein